jgi:hypothetical protein
MTLLHSANVNNVVCRLLDMGFQESVSYLWYCNCGRLFLQLSPHCFNAHVQLSIILKHLPTRQEGSRRGEAGRQTLLFSATVPKSVRAIAGLSHSLRILSSVFSVECTGDCLELIMSDIVLVLPHLLLQESHCVKTTRSLILLESLRMTHTRM